MALSILDRIRTNADSENYNTLMSELQEAAEKLHWTVTEDLPNAKTMKFTDWEKLEAFFFKVSGRTDTIYCAQDERWNRGDSYLLESSRGRRFVVVQHG